MKRSEVLFHIEEELKEFLENYSIASEKAKPHRIKFAADGILCFLEGFGMLPPGDEYTVHGVTSYINNKWDEESGK